MKAARGWPEPGDIVEEFWRRSGHPTQAQLNTLISTMGIPIMALARSGDGADFPIAMFKVERGRSTFEFGASGQPAIGFVAWDRDGFAQDLAAWSPRDNWLGTWLGRAGMLNEHETEEPRIGDRLRVFLHVADWLRAHREGVVPLDRAKAARMLEGRTVEAIDIADGLELQKLLERPRARIVVPAPAERRTAA